MSNITPRQWDGQPICEPGIYAGVPSEIYHGPSLCVGPSISSTGLRTIFHKSPKHYWCKSPYNPKRIADDDSEAMILGRAAHHALLGESDFDKHYVVRPAILNGKPWHGGRDACKDWLADARDAGLTVLTPEQRDAIIGMRDGLLEIELVSKGRMLDGLVEHTIVWQDEETGVWLKARPDVIPLSGDDGVDLKTTSDLSDDATERLVGLYGVNQQGALVAEGWRKVFGRDLQGFSLALVESKPPHCARIKSLKPHDLATGHEQNRLALRLFARGMATGIWHGPGGTQTDGEWVEIKPWARSRIEARISEIHQELAA